MAGDDGERFQDHIRGTLLERLTRQGYEVMELRMPGSVRAVIGERWTVHVLLIDARELTLACAVGRCLRAAGRVAVRFELGSVWAEDAGETRVAASADTRSYRSNGGVPR